MKLEHEIFFTKLFQRGYSHEEGIKILNDGITKSLEWKELKKQIKELMKAQKENI